MSDPTINGDLPSKDYRRNEQTTWAVGHYTACPLASLTIEEYDRVMAINVRHH